MAPISQVALGAQRVSPTGPEISLRPVSGDNGGFIFEVFAATRSDEFLAAGLPENQLRELLIMQFRALRSHYSAQYPNASWELIVQDGAAIGYWCLARMAETIVLVDFALLPEKSGSGAGTRLLGDLLREADLAGKPVRAHVKKNNRALSLYRRLGFEYVADDGIYLEITRLPLPLPG